MKKTFLFCVFLLLCCLPAICQSHKPNTPYDYALLHIIDEEDQYMVQFNNAAKEVSLWDTLKIDRDKESLGQAKVRCFQYLNKLGYELVSSSCFSIKIAAREEEVKYEYVFRKEQDRY